MATIQDIVNSVTSNPSTSSGIATPSNITAANTVYQNAISAEPQAVSNLNTSLQGQAGLPAQQSQYANLGSIFQLWLNDPSRTTGQYASSNLSTPNSSLYNSSTPSVTPIAGGPTFQNPYLQSASSIINAAAPGLESAVTNPTGFTGFSTPGLINSAVGVVPTAAAGIQSGLASTMSSEQGLINQDVSTYEQNYANTTNLMNQLVSALTSNENNYSTSGYGNTAPGSPSEGAALYLGILSGLGPNASADQVYNAINVQRSSLEKLYGPQVVDDLYAQQKQDKELYPTGPIGTGKVPTANAAAAKTMDYKIGNTTYKYQLNATTGQWDLMPGQISAMKSALDQYVPIFSQAPPAHLSAGEIGASTSSGTNYASTASSLGGVPIQ